MSCFIWHFFLIIQFYWIFITLHHGCSVTGSYIVISREEETWLNASRICKNTYRGKLIGSVEGSRQKTECLNKYTSRVELWSRNGLILSPFLSHEGCFHIINETMIRRISKKFNSIQSVGECYIYCQSRTSYFGIKNDNCYCISKNDIGMLQKSNRSACDNMCKDSTYDRLEFCGGRTALNLYRKIRLNGSQGSSKCAAIDCTFPYHLSVRSCDSRLHYVCAQEKYLNGPNLNFSEAMSLCNWLYNEYLSPSIISLCDSSQSMFGTKYWIDVRRYWVSTLDIDSHTKEGEFKCGYFISGISAQMVFTHNCISKRRYVCETDKIQKGGNASICLTDKDSKTNHVVKTSTSLATSSMKHLNFAINFSQQMEDKTVGYDEGVKREESKTDKNLFVIGIIVGLAIAVCIGLSIVLIIYCRRKHCKTIEENTYEGAVFNNESNTYAELQVKQSQS